MPGLGLGQSLREDHPCELRQVRVPESMRYINIAVTSKEKKLMKQIT